MAPLVSVHLRDLQFSHSSAVTVLSDVDLDLGPGLHVLVDLIRHAEIPMVIVVSHDRWVLDELTQSTLRIVDGNLQQWAGSWSQAQRLWQARETAARDAHDRARNDAALAHQRVAAARSNLSGIEVVR